ncbi:hypothetical protein BFP97_08195 [Roseivirga sp. 4D4]|uniref:hypothetical protein n=1 Tax=Roseivirga sp. 4D4 TaxID=1889784 RepID=UPI0008531C03|nr:hypothetical protein [Roseivirga sp. 4D4]OEK01502.1 hypothetical protein BFP97_08195 [Roseivirga sp. 4D4]
MKKLLVIAILSTMFLPLRGQERLLSPFNEEKNPLLVIQYNTEKIEFHDHNSSELLKAIPTEGISSIEVLKGNSAKALYGDSGKNGVIMLTLSKSDSNDLFFKKLQAGKLPSPQIKIDTDISISEKSSFTLDPSRFFEDGQLNIRGKSQLVKDGAIPFIILSLGNEQIELDKLTDLEGLDAKYLKSINVMKSKTDKDDADTIVVQLVKNSKTKRLFKKLKRLQKN